VHAIEKATNVHKKWKH